MDQPQAQPGTAETSKQDSEAYFAQEAERLMQAQGTYPAQRQTPDARTGDDELDGDSPAPATST